MRKRLAILYICTGKYTVFWNDFFKSVETNFLTNCHVEYFVFTDGSIGPVNDRVTIVECRHMGWPFDTLMRFHLFCGISRELKKFDYLFFLNANTTVTSKISEEILPVEENYVAVVHPGFYNRAKEEFTYERRMESLACMKPDHGEYYFMGAFNGGKAKDFLGLSQQLATNIDEDLRNGVIAVWHDESHLNRFLWDNRSKVKVLHAGYCYPEDQTLPFEQKVLVRDKLKFGGHNFLRKQL